MSSYKKRAGLFRHCKTYSNWKKNLSEVSRKRWASYRKSQLNAAVSTDHSYNKQNVSESKNVDDVEIQDLDSENISCEGLDVHEEQIYATPELPKNIKPIGNCRLIVELDHIIMQLNRGCKKCEIPLNMCSAKGVLTRGLGGWLYITCDNPACAVVNKVSIGKQHRRNSTGSNNPFNVSPSGNAIFDVNTKAASGMLHAGIGETHLNNLFTTMNLPQITHRSLKKCENEIGPILESFAKQSAANALMQEKELSEKQAEESETGSFGINVSVDTAWQKRGSQRSYSSLSGFTSTIGNNTKKIVHFNSRMKQCRICWRASKENKIPRKHHCRVNWHGSAKAMEPDMFIEMMKDSADQGIKIRKIAGDDDNTGINRIRKEGNVELVKESDKNHVRKNITKEIYALSTVHKSLSKKVICAITKNFNYMLQQNQGDLDGISKGLRAVVEHMFGNHDYCQDWCGFLKDPEKYKHANLPYGKDLSDESLHQSLTAIFTSLDANKLAHLSSTQANKSFNNTVASKAPKARHYSSSSSLQYRLCAGVSQKNEGHGYMTEVHKAAGLSPSLLTKKRGSNFDKHQMKRRSVASSIAFKRRRLILKSERNSKEISAEVREGDTYSSNIGQEKDVPDISEIPCVTSVCLPKDGNINYVMFDLETGGLARTSDIIQISAVCGKNEFNEYIFPTQPISKGASDVTHLSVANGKLCFKGNPVNTVVAKDGLVQFIAFLQAIQNPVLVRHNIKRFDLRLLHFHLNKYDLWKKFVSLVVGFVDTLAVFKKEYPKQSSYKQSNLMASLLNETYAAHNSLDDVKALQKLSDLVLSKFSSYIFDSSIVVNSVNAPRHKLTLEPLVTGKVISESMANKIAGAGLTYDHLKLAFDRNGMDGLSAVLSEKVNGKVRVTKHPPIIQRIFEHFTTEK